MLEQLEQMKELGVALESAIEAGDVDRVTALLKRRKELTDRMGHPDPGDPDVKSGKVAELLREIVLMDGTLEKKMRNLMGVLQDALQAVHGERTVVNGYLKQSDSGSPRYLDKEG